MAASFKFLMLSFTGIILTACAPSGAEHMAATGKPATIADSVVGYSFPWISEPAPENMVVNRVLVPEGYKRTHCSENSYGDWLRSLPVKPGQPKVRLHNGGLKWNQSAHAAVLDVDCGKEDLQQCADAVMRLRAEYLLCVKKDAAIHFNFTSGDEASWNKWKEGWRPVIKGNKVSWEKKASPSDSYDNFKKYLRTVFMYAGSASLEKELLTVQISDIKPGDVFIQGGHPGHAVLVLDVAEKSDGKKIFLLAQSYMPAQDIHILKNPENDAMSPWYEEDFGDILRTPEWAFKRTDLKRFKEY